MTGWKEGWGVVCIALQQRWNLEGRGWVGEGGRRVRLWGRVVLWEWWMRVDSSNPFGNPALADAGESLRETALI